MEGHSPTRRNLPQPSQIPPINTGVSPNPFDGIFGGNTMLLLAVLVFFSVIGLWYYFFVYKPEEEKDEEDDDEDDEEENKKNPDLKNKTEPKGSDDKNSKE